MKKTVFLSVILLCLPAYLFAADKARMDDKLISAAFKTLAKGMVLVADIEKVKAQNIVRLEKMRDDKFKKQYAKAYPAIKELPLKIKADYGISEEMSKGQAIKNIRSLDKNKIYAIIDAVPDEVIAGQFKQYLRNTKQQIENSKLVEQIRQFWNKATEKFKFPATISEPH